VKTSAAELYGNGLPSSRVERRMKSLHSANCSPPMRQGAGTFRNITVRQ
jgi:hypothetical protein